jgi:sec-independent protein translocase protein TatA
MGLDNPIHLALLLLIMLLVFGAKRLPEMGRSLGDGLRGFKDAVSPDSPTASAQTSTDTLMAAAPAQPVVATPAQPEAEAVPVAAVGSDTVDA